MTAYYNEIDPFAAAWLRELIKAGLIAPGDVDERSIEDVTPDDVAAYSQCHFFAGIGGWSYALRLAGWPDDRRVWTGSCPCQPFSAAGKGGGFADERHLWPAWFWLISQSRPGVVFGEQVASSDGLAWLDLVYSDLEGSGYAVGALNLCAAGFGAPHRRQRLYFVADTGRRGIQHDRPKLAGEAREGQGRVQERERIWIDAGNGGDADELDDAAGSRYSNAGQYRGRPSLQPARLEQRGPANGYWQGAEWLYCRDDKYRAVRPGTFPLAHGAPARVGRLRGYGNGIVTPQAAEFIKAYMTCGK